MKRKNEGNGRGAGKSKKRALSHDEARSNFRKGLFDSKVLEEYTKQYSGSKPYLHGVIQNLINTDLLRKVRDEIRENISFTPKETDIYKIHQSGDLANLDGLDDSSLRRLPSLLTLRDALYSSAFRKYISTVTNSGPLSGVKTDMAVNVYTPGCHLLCHDDVIGSRRVSYILYLLDPDTPWKPEWGGALRLYPTEAFKNADGVEVKVPTPDYSVVIPPAFNQLSFFTVQPGESFHDVEEVYKRAEGDNEHDGGRIRMAISGWFHIPQEGEEGYEEGLEEKLAERSSLKQLEGKDDTFDLPQPEWKGYEDEDPKAAADGEEPELSEQDIEFLLKFMTPHYLTPDTVDELQNLFMEESSLQLANFLSKKFSARLRTFLEAADSKPEIPHPAAAEKACGVARPPHKHRFLYRQAQRSSNTAAETPYDELIDQLFPSLAFKKWLSLATGLSLSQSNILARRFRCGMDYTLATSYEEDEPQLELTLGITPSPGWGEEREGDEEAEETEKKGDKNGKAKPQEQQEEDDVGGYEMYMAGDDDDDASDADSDGGVTVPSGSKKTNSTSTGAGNRRKTKADPAVYRSSGDDEDDGVLFSMPAGWNNMSIVLRDTGVLKFVKYVSRSAKGDRWDVCAEFGVVNDEDDEEE